MNEQHDHYIQGMNYESFIRRLSASTASTNAHCAGEMQALLNIEAGIVKRFRGQPTEAKWLDTIRKKVLKAYDKLLRIRHLAEADRKRILSLRENVEAASAAKAICELIDATWPIVHRLLPNK